MQRLCRPARASAPKEVPATAASPTQTDTGPELHRIGLAYGLRRGDGQSPCLGDPTG
jgi:hypothetical protein